MEEEAKTKEETLEQLNKNLEKISSRLGRYASYKQSFGLSIIRGIGFTIGATIIAGIVIAISAQLIHSAEDVPGLNRFVDTVVIQEVLREYEMQQSENISK